MPQKKIKNNAVATVKKTIENYSMFEYGDSVLVSVSGGPDSVFLTHALLKLRDCYGLKIYCFHLDHMSRQGQSAEDAGFVEKFCRSLGLKLFKKQVDAYKWCRQNRLSFQEGSRILRINFLSETAISNGIKKIAVGHTADDNLETFFINLLRGSGMRGLGGIRPVDAMFVRPIIECSRPEITDYLEKNNIKYCTDKTNLENIYLRNKVRNLLLPFIRKNIRCGFEKRILNTLKILREEDKYISGLAVDYLEKEAVFRSTNKLNKYPGSGKIAEITIPVSGLGLFPDAFKRRVIIAAVSLLKDGSADIKSASLEDSLKFMFASGESKTVAMADGIKVKKENDLLKIYRDPIDDASFLDKKAIEQYMVEPGKTIKAEILGIAVLSEMLTRKEAEERLSEKDPDCVYKKNEVGFLDNAKVKKNTPGFSTAQGKVKGKNLEVSLREKTSPGIEAFVDLDKIRFPLYVRKWNKKKGESFIPIGMNKQKKLHDFFIDEKVPESARIKIPVFSDTEKIIWVGRYRIDERVKVDTKTKKILYIKIFNI